MKSPELQKKMQQQEIKIQKDAEEADIKEITHTKQEIKAIWLLKAKGERQLQQKLMQMKLPNPQAANIVRLVETCKLNDELYVSHGVKPSYLQYAFEKMELVNDPDIKEFVESVKKESEQTA